MRGLAERLLAIARHCASLPDIDTRSPDEILGYDEHGLPSDVKKGQVLFDVDSPDLASAGGTLIQAAAHVELTTKALK